MGIKMLSVFSVCVGYVIADAVFFNRSKAFVVFVGHNKTRTGSGKKMIEQDGRLFNLVTLGEHTF